MAIYSEQNATRRRKLWQFIEDSKTIVDQGEWLVPRDLMRYSPDEKERHGNFDLQGAMEFNNAMRGLTELEAIGGISTWSNGFRQEHTRLKLD